MDPKKTPKILLIGWDGADWEHINPLLEQGLMPTFQRFLEQASWGNLATLQPVLSPMLWNSVATGKHAHKHGIHGFIEPDEVNGGIRPYTSTARKTKAIWNIFTQSGLRSNVVGWWASHPAEPIDGTIVTNAFAGVKFTPGKGWTCPPGAIHPKEKTPELAPMRVFPHELTQQHILPFIPDAAQIDQQADPRLEMFAKVLSECASVHAVSTAIMEQEPWDLTAIYFDTVDHMSHGFMQYYPPQMSNTRDEDFAMYQHVIPGTYRFHDMMLERQLQLAGPDTTVIICSDHGFQSGSQRPLGTPREPAGPAAWHRQYGIFAAMGPGIRKNHQVFGASLIDLCPTLLMLKGLPVGRDMDGRPLIEIMEEMRVVETIPSWDEVEGDSGMHGPGEALAQDQSEELLKQFAALGYIEDVGDDKEKQFESAGIEAKYNLAQNLAWSGKPNEALLLYEELLRDRPWEDRFITQLANAYYSTGYYRQAMRLLEAAFDLATTTRPTVLLLQGKLNIAVGEREAGLGYLQRAAALTPNTPGLHILLGDVFARTREWDKALSAYQKSVEIHADSARGYQGLSTVYRRQGKNQETVDAALKALSLLHRLPIAHLNLGIALGRAGETQRAVVALDTAIQFNPNMLNAHRWLIRLLGGQPDQIAKFTFHQQEIRRIAAGQRTAQPALAQRRDEVSDLPPIPTLEQRQAILVKERPGPEKPAEPSGKTFILVSGLPRSGTSLMMQMLEAGGLAAKTDGERTADDDNPRGYYEWEAIKQVAKQPDLFDEQGLEAKAIKVVTMLLKDLPKQHQYKVIFMMRPTEEIVASQAKMIEHRGTDGADLDLEQLARGLDSHRQMVLAALQKAQNFELIQISYPTLIKDPEPVANTLREFLGEERLMTPEAMCGAVDGTLYRNRQ